MATAYAEIRERLQAKILSGEYPVGQYLPSERAIASQYNVDRRTVRRALSILQAEGLVQIHRNKGAVVLDARSNGDATSFQGLGLVAFVAPFSSKSVLGASMVAGAHGVIEHSGMHLLLYADSTMSVMENLRHERANLLEITGKRVAGALVYYAGEEFNLNALRGIREAGIPLVLMDRYFPAFPCDTVTVDHVQGGYLATKHLIDLGHTRIAHVSVPYRVSSVMDRLEGYRRALADHGIAFDEQLVQSHFEHAEINARSSLDAYLSLKQPPTAVCTVNDQMAYQVWAEAELRGLRVPDDLAIVGFDNYSSGIPAEVGRLHRLTTVEHPIERVARDAARLLIRRMHGERSPEPEIQEIPTRLIIRESCGGLREALVPDVAREGAPAVF